MKRLRSCQRIGNRSRHTCHPSVNYDNKASMFTPPLPPDVSYPLQASTKQSRLPKQSSMRVPTKRPRSSLNASAPVLRRTNPKAGTGCTPAARIGLCPAWRGEARKDVRRVGSRHRVRSAWLSECLCRMILPRCDGESDRVARQWIMLTMTTCTPDPAANNPMITESHPPSSCNGSFPAWRIVNNTQGTSTKIAWVVAETKSHHFCRCALLVKRNPRRAKMKPKRRKPPRETAARPS